MFGCILHQPCYSTTWYGPCNPLLRTVYGVPRQVLYLEGTLNLAWLFFVHPYYHGGSWNIPNAAMFVICARGVLAVPGAALIMIPFKPVACQSSKFAVNFLTYHNSLESRPTTPPLAQHPRPKTRFPLVQHFSPMSMVDAHCSCSGFPLLMLFEKPLVVDGAIVRVPDWGNNKFWPGCSFSSE